MPSYLIPGVLANTRWNPLWSCSVAFSNSADFSSLRLSDQVNPLTNCTLPFTERREPAGGVVGRTLLDDVIIVDDTLVGTILDVIEVEEKELLVNEVDCVGATLDDVMALDVILIDDVTTVDDVIIPDDVIVLLGVTCTDVIIDEDDGMDDVTLGVAHCIDEDDPLVVDDGGAIVCVFDDATECKLDVGIDDVIECAVDDGIVDVIVADTVCVEVVAGVDSRESPLTVKSVVFMNSALSVSRVRFSKCSFSSVLLRGTSVSTKILTRI